MYKKKKKNGPDVIVVGNEKGGSGKSTLAIHIAVAAADAGRKIGTIDMDSRQGTLTRFIQNRQGATVEMGLDLPCPIHIPLEKSQSQNLEQKQAEEARALLDAMASLKEQGCDAIIIDTAGTDNTLAWLAHQEADILVSPINDSFVDLDLLAKINPETLEIIRPNVYAERVWKIRQARALKGKTPADWYVIRNRISHINANNKKDVAGLLEKLQKRFAFTLVNGMGERVIYRELFLKGLTLTDMKNVPGYSLRMSDITGRQEIRTILKAIGLNKKPEHSSITASDNSSLNDNMEQRAEKIPA